MSKLNKTVVVYTFLAVFAVIFTKIYGLFGHGVTSLWMSNMYLVLVGGGAVIFLTIKGLAVDITDCTMFRLFYNIYNSGIAIIVNGMLLKGILEIAGATSGIVVWFLYVGTAFIVCAVLMLGYMLYEKYYKKGAEVKCISCKDR